MLKEGKSATPSGLTSVDNAEAERTWWKDKIFRATCKLMKVTVLAESSKYFIFSLVLSAPMMPKDMSQVGVTLFPSFLTVLMYTVSSNTHKHRDAMVVQKPQKLSCGIS